MTQAKEPASGELIETYRGTVSAQHLDHMGHMNIQHYVAKFDEGVWHLFNRIGITPGYMREEKRGMAAVETNIRYKRELYAGDLIVMCAGVLRVSEKSLHFVEEMREAATGELAAVMRAVAVHLDRNARRATPFPDAIAACAREFIVDYPEV